MRFGILTPVRKTKIICTLGPASGSTGVIQGMICSGVDVFRVNMSHATHEWVRELVPRVRSIARELERNIALMLDTQGPAIRTGILAKDLHLEAGDILEITVRGARSTEPKSITVNYDQLIDDVAVDNVILLDNGLLQVRVLEKKDDCIRTRVVTEGTLGSRRHINLPGVDVNLPALTEKDLADVALGIELGFDFVALSFARRKEDLAELRKLLRQGGSTAAVVAKIESQSAVHAIDEMISATDVLLVARGDLGIECPMEELPIIQRRIVKRCLRIGKPVVVATQLLESMTENPVPTRAEVTDVSNAVFEQADAIMLTGETTSGRYPIECVRVLDRVALRIEQSGGAGYGKDAILKDARQKLVASAVSLANSLHESKLVVFTRHGTMARYVSNLRPAYAPIFAFTPNDHVCRQLAICWGVSAAPLEFSDDPNATIEAAEVYLRERKLVSPNDYLVVVSDVQAGTQLVDCLQLRFVR